MAAPTPLTSLTHKRCLASSHGSINAGRLQSWLLLVALTLMALPGHVVAVGMGKSQTRVAVSIPPQAFFLEAIGGELLHVTVLLDSGQDPHTYSPNSAQMVQLGEVRAFFPAGLGIEAHWLEKIKRMFPAIEWVKDENLKLDSHFWLSPKAVMRHVKIMHDTLIRLDPENAELYSNNTEQFVQSLQQLDEQFSALFEGAGERNRFLVQHAAWDAFAVDYGLKQLVIEEEGKAAGIKHLASLISVARDLQIDTVFADVAHSSKLAQSVARQSNAQLVMLNPVSADWQQDLIDAATKIKAALR